MADKTPELRKIQPDDFKVWKAYHAAVEESLRKDPWMGKYSDAFMTFKVGSKLKDKLVFRVKILDGRISFGKLQFLVIPHEALSVNGICGNRWVARKNLIMEHDKDFDLYSRATDPEKLRT